MTDRRYGHGYAPVRKRPTVKTPCTCPCGCTGYMLRAYRLPKGADADVLCASCRFGTHAVTT